MYTDIRLIIVSLVVLFLCGCSRASVSQESAENNKNDMNTTSYVYEGNTGNTSIERVDFGNSLDMLGEYVAIDNTANSIIQETGLSLTYDDYNDRFWFTIRYLDYACTGEYHYADGILELDIEDILKQSEAKDYVLYFTSTDGKKLVFDKDKSTDINSIPDYLIRFSDAVQQEMIFELKEAVNIDTIINKSEDTEYDLDFTPVDLGNAESLIGEYCVVSQIEGIDVDKIMLILNSENSDNFFELVGDNEEMVTSGKYEYDNGVLRLIFTDVDTTIGISKERSILLYSNENKQFVTNGHVSPELTHVNLGLPVMYLEGITFSRKQAQ